MHNIKTDLLKVSIYIHSLSVFLLIALIMVIDFDTLKFVRGKLDFLSLLMDNWKALSIIILLLWGLLYQYVFDYFSDGAYSQINHIKSVKNKTFDSMMVYFTSNIVPLLSFDLHSDKYFYTAILIVIMNGLIFIKTDMYYLNPTLAIFGGHRVFKVTFDHKETKKDDELIIITKDELTLNEKIKVKKISSNVFIGKKV